MNLRLEAMPRIVVTPEAELDDMLSLHRPEVVVCFGSPSRPPVLPRGVRKTLGFTFHDITEPREGHVAPTRADMERFASLVGEWPQRAPLLLQCWMGVSRSTAAALVALSALGVTPDDAAQSLRNAAPFATPNALMLSHADAVLRLEGTLVDAGRRIGRGGTTDRGRAFTLEVPA